MDWVNEKLESDGWFSAQKLQQRESMRSKERRHLANDIVDRWAESGSVKALYGDFKANLDAARTKSTTGGRSRMA